MASLRVESGLLVRQALEYFKFLNRLLPNPIALMFLSRYALFLPESLGF